MAKRQRPLPPNLVGGHASSSMLDSEWTEYQKSINSGHYLVEVEYNIQLTDILETAIQCFHKHCNIKSEHSDNEEEISNLLTSLTKRVASHSQEVADVPTLIGSVMRLAYPEWDLESQAHFPRCQWQTQSRELRNACTPASYPAAIAITLSYSPNTA